VVACPCAEENGGKKKRGAGRGDSRFKLGQWRGGKGGGSGRGCHVADNRRRGAWPDSGGGRSTPALEQWVWVAHCAWHGQAAWLA
jgi:hypothetical protein